MRKELHLAIVTVYIISIGELRQHCSAGPHAIRGQRISLTNQRIEERALSSARVANHHHRHARQLLLLLQLHQFSQPCLLHSPCCPASVPGELLEHFLGCPLALAYTRALCHQLALHDLLLRQLARGPLCSVPCCPALPLLTTVTLPSARAWPGVLGPLLLLLMILHLRHRLLPLCFTTLDPISTDIFRWAIYVHRGNQALVLVLDLPLCLLL
mmetsp:Transcript_10304/g.28102  ORF Transcript_10304/g.28102 Transcript_10304/m.28102 type:complete len:213 (+) Transcript_10304:3005-3643(+)